MIITLASGEYPRKVRGPAQGNARLCPDADEPGGRERFAQFLYCLRYKLCLNSGGKKFLQRRFFLFKYFIKNNIQHNAFFVSCRDFKQSDYPSLLLELI